MHRDHSSRHNPVYLLFAALTIVALFGLSLRGDLISHFVPLAAGFWISDPVVNDCLGGLEPGPVTYRAFTSVRALDSLPWSEELEVGEPVLTGGEVRFPDQLAPELGTVIRIRFVAIDAAGNSSDQGCGNE